MSDKQGGTIMRYKGFLLMVVFTLFLGFVAPAWASHTADPLEEEYYAHVLPYYNVGTGFQSFAVFADTSNADPQFLQNQGSGCDPGRDTPCRAQIHLYFFNQDCQLVRDQTESLTQNDVLVVPLGSLGGIPNEGVIFADTGFFQGGAQIGVTASGGFQRFLTYIILVSLADNTLTRIDSIPFSPALETGTDECDISQKTPCFAPIPDTGHWTRYDPINTVAATFGDSTLTAIGEIRTTLMFFNALGGGVDSGGTQVKLIGAIDTLREFMLVYGRPRSPFGAGGGDWVTTGLSSTANVTPGTVEMDAYDGDENFVGSFRIQPRCFERVRLATVLPVLATPAPGPGVPRFFLGHVVTFSLPDAQRVADRTCGPTGQCSFSGFQETVVEGGAVDLIFSGYMHHSHAERHEPVTVKPGQFIDP
jgi:hypothetical protein